MFTKERVIHTLLFEAFALVAMVIIGMLVMQENVATLSGLAIVLSLIAMAWNYFYNVVFDKIFGAERIARTLVTRIWHGLGFEGGLVIFTLPLMMWWLDLDFLSALLLDLGAVVFFLVYAIVFNWLYDIIRHHFFNAGAPLID